MRPVGSVVTRRFDKGISVQAFADLRFGARLHICFEDLVASLELFVFQSLKRASAVVR